MRGNEFLDKMELIDYAYVEAAEVKQEKNKRTWVKLGAVAACLCLTVCIALPGLLIKDAGSGFLSGGKLPEGVDPIISSIAVFPGNESLANVADATVITVTENDAKNIEDLGEYLPVVLSEKYCYSKASYYKTVMKDGSRYHMIYATYTSVADMAENTQNESEMISNTAFLWMVLGHRPETSRPIYEPGEISKNLLEKQEGLFYIDCGGIYIGISGMDIEDDKLLCIIESVLEK